MWRDCDVGWLPSRRSQSARLYLSTVRRPAMFSFLSMPTCPPIPTTSFLSPMFLTGNVLLAGAQVLPQHSSSLREVVRLLLTLAHIAFSSWALTQLCSGTIFCWHSLLGLASLAKLSEALWRCWPARLSNSVSSLYTEVFQPLSVSKEDFLLILKDSRVEQLGEGQVWCREAGRITEGLSVLLSGRLAARADGCLLHKIEANQFIQSIEWSARKQESQLEHYQVEVEVEESPCSILHLNPHWLDHIIETRRDLKLILECVIGKDISMKLYMMNKMIGEVCMKKEPEPESEVRLCKKSSSMDAINTGWRGIMRSHVWTAEGREEQAFTPVNPDLDLPRDLTMNLTRDLTPQPNTKLQWPNNMNQYKV